MGALIQDFDGDLELEFFSAADIEQAIAAVEERSQDGVVQGNVKLLLKLLSHEVNRQGLATAQRQLQMAVSVAGVCSWQQLLTLSLFCSLCFSFVT